MIIRWYSQGRLHTETVLGILVLIMLNRSLKLFHNVIDQKISICKADLFFFFESISKLEWSFATNSFRGFVKELFFNHWLPQCCTLVHVYIKLLTKPRFPKSIGWHPLSQNLTTSRTIFTHTLTNSPCHIKSYDGRQNRSTRGPNALRRDHVTC